jgi:hypothetical protein
MAGVSAFSMSPDATGSAVFVLVLLPVLEGAVGAFGGVGVGHHT